MTLSHSDYAYIYSLVYEHAAIVLEADKGYLVETRLLPLARQEGFASLEELIVRLRAVSFNDLHQRVVEAMTTNETSFFRDMHPFEALKTVILPELIEKRASVRTLHIWCAACASGQEPYSVAMLLHEHFPQLMQWEVRIMASDISSEMLQLTQAGCYRQLEVNRGLPAALLVKYFQRRGLVWQIHENLRQRLECRQFNLAGAWPPLPDMDLILMRNVLIYFDIETKQAILGNVRQVLRPDGYLFLGSVETTRHLDDAFERVQINQASCYRLRTG